MGAIDLLPACESCGNSVEQSRCGGVFPDSPSCAINYHFGMLLGVDDFRTEQGFHLSHHRRHQRWLHGFGVVYGFDVTYDKKTSELHVSAGLGVDRQGRDLYVDVDQCLNLPAWWDKHKKDAFFLEVSANANAVPPFDADVVLCARTCLARPVPAIADPCAQSAMEIAYSRICESFELTLVPTRRGRTEDGQRDPTSHHLVRLLAGLDDAATDEHGKVIKEDALALRDAAKARASPAAHRRQKVRALWQAVAARAAIAEGANAPRDDITMPQPDDSGNHDSKTQDCLVIAHLRGVALTKDQAGHWQAVVDGIDTDGRPTLLPTSVMQELLLAQMPAAGGTGAAGPLLVDTETTISGKKIALVFDKRLAEASVGPNAFVVSEFVEATGWAPLDVTKADYDDATRTATLTLNRAPTQDARVRLAVRGSGMAPLLGSDLTPFAASTTAGDGVDRFITI